MNAQAEKEIYVKDQIDKIPNYNDANMIPIGNSMMHVDRRKIMGENNTPGYASSMLAQIDQNVPIYENAGVNFNALAMVPTIRNLTSQITTQQRVDPEDPDDFAFARQNYINRRKKELQNSTKVSYGPVTQLGNPYGVVSSFSPNITLEEQQRQIYEQEQREIQNRINQGLIR